MKCLATRAAVGLVAAGLVAGVARRARALSPAGVVAATGVGAATYAGMGVRGGVALVAFFASSTLLGRLPAPTTRRQRRGNERDAVQVLANGGVAALLAAAAGLAPAAARTTLRAGFGGAVATAAADTWATEIGTRRGGQPRSIATLRRVPAGSSGGVSLAGLVASAGGAALIGVILGPLAPRSRPAVRPAFAVAAGGVAGALTDSVLGATLQEVRVCVACYQETELLVHDCGGRTRHLRGVSWCGNDAVNALATAMGALTAMAIASRGRSVPLPPRSPRHAWRDRRQGG
jgi:uncharacterized protein (TIGR00297 family)